MQPKNYNSLTRREFIKAAGVTAAGVVVGSFANGPASSSASTNGLGWAEFVAKEKPIVSQPWKADVVFHVGSKGIADGGGFRFYTPVQSWADAKITPDHIKVKSESPVKAELTSESRSVLGSIITVKITGGSLSDGDKVIYNYDPAWLQKYTQTGMVCKIDVDTNGDGKFEELAEEFWPKIDIVNRPAAHLRIVAQQIVKPGQTITVRSIVLDDFNNPVDDREYTKPIRIGILGSEGERKYSQNLARFDLQAPSKPGLYHIHGVGSGLEDAYLPIRVSDDQTPNIYWGQLHGHTNSSDGCDTIEHYYAYGRDVGMIDVCAGNDHAEAMTRNDSWQRNITAVRNFYKPGEYVTLAGFEWTAMGHRNVYFADATDDLPVIPAYGEFTTDYWAFVKQLKETRKEVIIGYHTAHPVDFQHYAPDIHRLEELHSMWGTSEFPGNTGWTKLGDKYVPMSSAQTALARGQKFGFVGGGDSHHGRPGRYWFGSRWGIFGHKEGAAAILAPKLERRDIFDALSSRHTYASTGERILIIFTINGHQMGEEFETSEKINIHFEVGATGPLDKVELVRNNQPIWAKYVEGMSASFDITDESLTPGAHWYYLRVTQKKYDRAWSSPIWVTFGARS